MKSHIILIEPLPSINKIFSLIVQQERQMSIGIISESKILMIHVAIRNLSIAKILIITIENLILKVKTIKYVLTMEKWNILKTHIIVN